MNIVMSISRLISKRRGPHDPQDTAIGIGPTNMTIPPEDLVLLSIPKLIIIVPTIIKKIPTKTTSFITDFLYSYIQLLKKNNVLKN